MVLGEKRWLFLIGSGGRNLAPREGQKIPFNVHLHVPIYKLVNKHSVKKSFYPKNLASKFSYM